MSNIQNVIVDLRHNGGGYISLCDSLVELFLPDSVPFIETSFRNFNGPGYASEVSVADTTGDLFEGKKVVVFIDAFSASASEIFAVALRDAMNPNAIRLIGTTSYGKGIGQFEIPLSKGDTLKVTTLRFFRVKDDQGGRDYHRKGIAPDIEATTNAACFARAGEFLEGTPFKPLGKEGVFTSTPRSMSGAFIVVPDTFSF
jgi:carboxyl-terminal processing protease